MRPHEALPQDWNLYYNNTYMLHKDIGPVFVRVGHGGLHVKKADRPNDEWQIVEPESLSVWFPRTGAFNTSKNALYIARRAARSMRKSMSLGDLYYVKHGERVQQHILAKYLTNVRPSYTPGQKAIELLMDPTCDVRGRAISREYMLLSNKRSALRGNTGPRTYQLDNGDIVHELLDEEDEDEYNEGNPIGKRPVKKVPKPPEPPKIRITAYFKGHQIGTLDDNGVVVLNNPAGPLARRIVRDLSKEGVQCDSLIQ